MTTNRIGKSVEQLHVNPHDIIVLSEIQSRVGELNKDVVEEYAQFYRDGHDFPFIKVVCIDDAGSEYYDQLVLAEGFHRLEAAKLADIEKLKIEVWNGDLDKAKAISILANQKNGLRRTNADKRNAVIQALEHPYWKGMSDRAVAQELGVTHPFIANVRQEQENRVVNVTTCKFSETDKVVDAPAQRNPSHEKRIGKDGKSYPAKPNKPLRKTVAAEREPETRFLKIPLPFNHCTAYKPFFDEFFHQDEAIKNRVIAEAEFLASVMQNLTD
jgi:hypothetical protein